MTKATNCSNLCRGQTVHIFRSVSDSKARGLAHTCFCASMPGLVIMAMMMNHELCYDELKIYAKLDFTRGIQSQSYGAVVT